MDIDTTDLYEDADPQIDADWLAGLDPAPELSYVVTFETGFTFRGRDGWPMNLVRFEATEASAQIGAGRIIAIVGEYR